MNWIFFVISSTALNLWLAFGLCRWMLVQQAVQLGDFDAVFRPHKKADHLLRRLKRFLTFKKRHQLHVHLASVLVCLIASFFVV